jgi:hypothetical protein
MEPISLTFYAAVCGILGVVAPKLGGFLPRLLIGAFVGIIAAILLPSVRGFLTGY